MLDSHSRTFKALCLIISLWAAVLPTSALASEDEPVISYQNPDDWDNDGAVDSEDNCPFHANTDQVEADRDQGGDRRGDPCDNCPLLANADQADQDADGFGDLCDNDQDGDFHLDERDNCPSAANNDQLDADSDKEGDACDTDIDGDSAANDQDDCPFGEARGCFDDLDDDGVLDFPKIKGEPKDNCRAVPNPEQSNLDSDSLGDACDLDLDGDGVPNTWDNCPKLANADQADEDRDGTGDACDDLFCYAVNGDTKNCLSYAPGSELAVYLASASDLRTKQPVQLHLFANRKDARLSYEMTFLRTTWPDYGQASIENATGQTTDDASFEYHYAPGLEPIFEAREPGVYEITVIATVTQSDPAFPGEEGQSATSSALLEVTGKSYGDIAGCSCQQLGVLPGPPLLSYLMLALAAVLLAFCRRD
ncbi:MAG: thrombospondin type 3 repeat-containing protein [Myxococcota bacterium]|nr:thrombospondin type 3 repeat-containing protein [Myxococcota bacterium]